MANENMTPTSGTVLTPEQLEAFQKACIWNDGWYAGWRECYKKAKAEGLIKGLIAGGIAAATAIVATWMYKYNKTYRIDITDVSEKKEDSENGRN